MLTNIPFPLSRNSTLSSGHSGDEKQTSAVDVPLPPSRDGSFADWQSLSDDQAAECHSTSKDGIEQRSAADIPLPSSQDATDSDGRSAIDDSESHRERIRKNGSGDALNSDALAQLVRPWFSGSFTDDSVNSAFEGRPYHRWPTGSFSRMDTV